MFYLYPMPHLMSTPNWQFLTIRINSLSSIFQQIFPTSICRKWYFSWRIAGEMVILCDWKRSRWLLYGKTTHSLLSNLLLIYKTLYWDRKYRKTKIIFNYATGTKHQHRVISFKSSYRDKQFKQFSKLINHPQVNFCDQSNLCDFFSSREESSEYAFWERNCSINHVKFHRVGDIKFCDLFEQFIFPERIQKNPVNCPRMIYFGNHAENWDIVFSFIARNFMDEWVILQDILTIDNFMFWRLVKLFTHLDRNLLIF